jgi:hypothetical protein
MRVPGAVFRSRKNTPTFLHFHIQFERDGSVARGAERSQREPTSATTKSDCAHKHSVDKPKLWRLKSCRILLMNVYFHISYVE